MHYHTVSCSYIHLLCDTNRPSSVSNLHYAQALPGPETTAACNGCQSKKCHCSSGSPLAGPQQASGGPQLAKYIKEVWEEDRKPAQSRKCVWRRRKTRTETSSVIECQHSGKHFIWWDRLKCVDSSNFKREALRRELRRVMNSRLPGVTSLILLDFVNDKLLSCRVGFKTHLFHHHSQAVDWE